MEKLFRLCNGVWSVVPFGFGFSPTLILNEKDAFCFTAGCSLEAEGLQSNVKEANKPLKRRTLRYPKRREQDQLLMSTTEEDRRQKAEAVVILLQGSREQRQMDNGIMEPCLSTLMKKNANFVVESSYPVDIIDSHFVPSPHLPKKEGSTRNEADIDREQEKSFTSEGDNQYKCHYCEYSSPRKRNLSRHLRKHTGYKPYTCTFPECQKSFSEACSKRKHLRTHTGEKLFKCPHCDFSSIRMDGLTSHLRVHTGDKPYRCQRCEKTFAYRHRLTYHTSHRVCG